MRHTKLLLFLLLIPIFGWFLWHTWNTESTVNTLTSKEEKAGESILSDLQTIPSLPMTEDKDSFIMKDDTSDGISIQFANQEDSSLGEQDKQDPFTLSFPKDYSKPVEIKLDKDRSIRITDQSQSSFSPSLLSTDAPETSDTLEKDSFFTSIKKTLGLGKQTLPKTFLSYQSDDERKTLLYAYQKDQGTGEKKLKHWTLYQKGNGLESESYKIEGAKVRIQDGVAQIFYFGDQDLKNQEAQAQVEPSLMERAQRTLAKEMGEDILNSSKTPDFTIPKPYYIDREGTKTETDWKWDEEKQILSLSFSVDQTKYPIALDPTLSFTAPGQSNSGDVITGEVGTGSSFGTAMVTGDFNNDGKMDLAVGASGYSSNTGRVYIFYNDGGISTTAITADVTITGETTTNYFGYALTSGDLNADGKTDLVASAYGYSSFTGRTYIFYNDGTIPTTAATADVTITGETTSNSFGRSLTSGDLNADGKTDLAIGAYGYSTNTGRAYIFYNDGSIPTTAATADVTVTGGAIGDYFGNAITTSDLNADGKTDLVASAYRYSTNTGRVYLFYNDGSIPTTAATADVTITGETTTNYFGYALTSGDLNADGKTDLVASAYGYSSFTGRTYIFYNDGTIPTTAATADVTITGETTSNSFGASLATGDLNVDGKTDLAIGAYDYSFSAGRAYIFYGDGSISTTAATADVIITGETTSNNFGIFLIASDLNVDGKTDLVIGANNYSSTGRAYIFYSQNGQVNTNVNITGEATNNYFGQYLTSGDFNADGRTDLAVGAYGYSSSTGRVYIFYNDGSIPTTAATADVIITGTASSSFGSFLAAGDVNADGKTDLLAVAGSNAAAHIFYNDGSYTSSSATADVIISGGNMGDSVSVGDLNTDGKPDILVAASGYGGHGRAYLYYADGTNNFGSAACTGSAPTTCSSSNADIIVDGASGARLNRTAIGDVNADGRADMLLGGMNNTPGYVYILYNDGTSFGTSACTTACAVANADVTITGEGGTDNFSSSLQVGDFNADGRVDVLAGAESYSSNTGRVYIFYNDGSYPSGAGSADVIVTGAGGGFGRTAAVGDFNADGRTDFVAGVNMEAGVGSKAYIFYNDGSYPTTAATADAVITGESFGDGYETTFVTGDFNADGRTDLVVGAWAYSSRAGKVYVFETRENFAWKLQPVAANTGGLRTGTNGTGQEMQITGETGASQFGTAFATGDFNTDGKIDLAVGAALTGRTYIFYSDGSLSSSASSADVIITGESNSHYFGNSLMSGDFNTDGKTDLAVGAFNYSSSTGRAYIFYNDGSIPNTAATADVIITGETTNNYFGWTLTAGDLNADGRTDLVVGAYYYSSSTGRAYIFYNDGSIPTTAATADVVITGETTNNEFSRPLAVGDFNADGKTDLAVGARAYSSNTGRVYIFYNDGSIPTTAATADVIITGGASESLGGSGTGIVSGDFNADGRTDLGVLGVGTGKVFLFYNDGSIPTTSATADVTITGFSVLSSIATGDFNADGRTDLVVGDTWPAGGDYTGRAYIFYNDGSIPTTMATADVALAGQSASGYFGYALTSGDFNADGRTDLVVGAYRYASDTGRVYMYTFNDSVITGEATSNYFGVALTSGDFNADGKTDLAVGASRYSTNTGRVYIFYSDGNMPATAATADVTITGEATGNYFGNVLTAGDLNADGKIDLVSSAYRYSSDAGRVYIFYCDGSIPTTAATADVVITGQASTMFGYSMVTGDFNTDGKIDLAAGTYSFNGYYDRAFIFYNDGSIPTTAATADVYLTGDSGTDFGVALAAGDLNADGRTDLVVGAEFYSTFTGRVYIFYNDGSMPTTAATADVTITGEAINSYVGTALATGDFNADGRTDLAIGAYLYGAHAGRVYILYNDGSIPTAVASADVIISGSGDDFGNMLAAGDFNADGRIDLAVTGPNYSSGSGRVYLFYNDGSLPTTAATADAFVTGEAITNYFGWALASGDFNTDGKTDLAVGAYGYSTNTGRAYIFTTEAKAQSSAVKALLRGTGKIRGTGKLK